MKKFRFDLEPVRALREQAEKRAQEELAHELAAHARIEAALGAVAQELEAVRRAGVPTPGVPVAAADLAGRDAYLARRERDRQETERRLDDHGRVVELRRSMLEQSARERESVERLKQRALGRYLRAADKEQEALADEVATTAYSRRLRADSR